MISYEDFKKVEIRAGKILSAEKIPDTDKLLRLSVDFGEKAPAMPSDVPIDPANPEVVAAPAVSQPRQIVSGIAMYFPDPSALVGKTCMFVTNLEPRTIRGLESNGMLFAVSTPAGPNGEPGEFSLLEPGANIPAGTMAK